MTEKDLEIQELKMKIKKLEEEKQFIINYIEQNCVYDNHLQGYCMGLTPGEVKTLVLKLGGKKEV
jgi:hypothetical protein